MRCWYWLIGSAALACSPAGHADTSGGTSEGNGGQETVPAEASSSSADGSSSSSADGSSSSAGAVESCNGSPLLCDRRYDAVVFPATHNSVAATESGFAAINANQTRPILQQLNDGIRVLLLDVAYDGENTALCHGLCALGSRPHVEVLSELRGFLDDNPRDVVTIIYQDSVDAADIEADFAATELTGLTYVHGDRLWPTLAEMIDAGTRLVVTAEVGRPPPNWLHHVWDLAWDTPYTFSSVEDFNCGVNRGSAEHGLLLVNHWISTEAGLPAASEAATANSAVVLMARAAQCQATAGRKPSFIAVDYYDRGDLFAVVDALNGVP